MKVFWKVVPIGGGEFRLLDHEGREVTTVRRKREVILAGYEYLKSDRRGEADDIVFEGIERIPSCVGRLIQRLTRFSGE